MIFLFEDKMFLKILDFCVAGESTIFKIWDLIIGITNHLKLQFKLVL